MPAKGLEEDNRLQANVEDVDEEGFEDDPPKQEKPVATKGRESSPSSRRRGRKDDDEEALTVTMYLSDNVNKRLDAYRRQKTKRTNRDVVIEAITRFHNELPELLERSKVSTAVESELFPADERQIRYLGGGGIQSQFTPTPAQAKVLQALSDKLGFPKGKRSTWIPPVLNEFLPGRKVSPGDVKP